MPGAKRKLDEDTWIVSQSKKFKQGILLSSVYDTTLAHLRLGARNFFNSLMMRSENNSRNGSPVASPGASRQVSPINTPPGSPVVQDVISDNELQTVASIIRPSHVCQDCAFQNRNGLGYEEPYGKCGYCDKVACHINCCRGCGNSFCGQCSIAKYDDSAAESYECYNCLH